MAAACCSWPHRIRSNADHFLIAALHVIGRPAVAGRFDRPDRQRRLWRVPVGGGEEVPVLPRLASYGNFAVASDGIYFEERLPGNPLGHTPDFTPFTRLEAAIDFLSFATGKVNRVLTLDRHAGHGLDVSPDGRTLLFAQMDDFTEDLMLVEHFR